MQELVSLEERPVHLFDSSKVHAALRDVLHDRVYADDRAAIVADRRIASDAGVLLGRVARAHFEIEDRLTRGEHAPIDRLQLIGELGRRHLAQRASYVFSRWPPVILGKPIVDVNVAQVTVDASQANGRACVRSLQVNRRGNRIGVGRKARSPTCGGNWRQVFPP
jgi:hypothetical protein